MRTCPDFSGSLNRCEGVWIVLSGPDRIQLFSVAVPIGCAQDPVVSWQSPAIHLWDVTMVHCTWTQRFYFIVKVWGLMGGTGKNYLEIWAPRAKGSSEGRIHTATLILGGDIFQQWFWLVPGFLFHHKVFKCHGGFSLELVIDKKSLQAIFHVNQKSLLPSLSLTLETFLPVFSWTLMFCQTYKRHDIFSAFRLVLSMDFVDEGEMLMGLIDPLLFHRDG